MKTPNKPGCLLASIAALAIVIASPNAFGASVTLGSSTPSVGDGVQNLSFSTDDASNTQVQYVNSDYIGHQYRGNDLMMGQSFTTGTNVYGYSLSAISVRQVGWGPTDWDFTGGTVTLRIFSMPASGGPVWNATQLVVETATVSGTGSPTIGGYPAEPQWLTVTLATNVTLAANKVYAFAIGSSGGIANEEFFMNLDGTSANSYAGGFACSIPTNEAAFWDGGNGQPSDRAFVATMTAAAPPTDFVWDGGGANNDWTNALNWVGDFAPATSGNIVTFGGATRLAPNMNANYSVASVTFDSTAGSFNIGTDNSSTLTVAANGIINNSANAQTLSVPVILSAAQTFNAASGSLTLNSNVTGGADLTTTGSSSVTFASPGTNTIGNLKLTSGQVNITAGTVNVTDTSGFNTRMEGDSTLTVSSGATLNVGGVNCWWPIGVTAGQTATIEVNGGTINVVNSWGTEIGNENGSGVLTINSGTFINNDTLPNGLYISDGTAEGGTVNLNGGNLIVNKIIWGGGANGQFFFNGGTLKPLASRTDFWNYNATHAASIRNGGAIVDTTNFNVTIAQPLIHSTVGGDNEVDGGLTKTGNGTLRLSGGYTYTGPTKIFGGTLSLDSSLPFPGSAGDLVVSNATLLLDASSGYMMPAANITLHGGASLHLTNNASANAVYGLGNLLVESNTTWNLHYGALGSNPSVAAINAAGSMSVTGTNNVINISGTGFTVGQFPLIKYGSGSLASIDGLQLGTLPVAVIAELVNNTDNQSVDLNITFIGQSLTWYGADAAWDINTTYNWNGASAVYLEYGSSPNIFGDLVTFDDTLYNDFSNPQATNVNLVTTLRPTLVTVNSSLPYSFTGAGSLAGAGGVAMIGSGSLFLGTSNSFTGGVTVSAGTLIVTNDAALGTNSGTLTLGGGTLEVDGNLASTRPVSLTAASTVSVVSGAAAQLSGLITGGNDLTTTGDGTLTLSPAGTNTIGNLKLTSGQLNITTGTVNVTETSGFDTRMEGNSTLTVSSGATLNIVGTASWWPVGVTAGQTATIEVNGGTINVANNWGTEIGNEVGSGVLTINSGTFINNDQSSIGLYISDGTAEGGTVNLNGGNLIVNKIIWGGGANGQFFFNGGTLKPLASRTDFWNYNAAHAASIRNGGAIVDTTNFNVTIGQPLLHSTVGGDNAVDGGLTKTGNGTLTLAGANTYTGNTTINAGTLALLQATPVLATNSTVAIASGAALQLVNGAVTNHVTGLLTNGVAAGNGLYGSANSSGYITGAGHLQVGPFSAGPDLSQNHLTNSITGGGTTLSLAWSPGWKLQAQTNSLDGGLGTNWTTITDGTATSTNLPIVPSNPSVFYRLINQ